MKISTFIVLLATACLAQNATAIRVTEGTAETTAAPSPSASSEHEGLIEKVDLGGRAMIVDGVRYSFSAASVTVHGASPLTLGKNDRIRFKVQSESGQGRIVEIWLISAARH